MEIYLQKRKLSRLMVMTLGVFVLLAILAAATPQAAFAAKCTFRYKVQPGDTLIYVAQLYQIDWREIAEANNLKEPYVLVVGEKLCIPGGTAPEDGTTTTGTAGSTPSGKATLTASASGSFVYVKVEKFPRYKVYYVRVANDPLHGDDPNSQGKVYFWKVGRLKTDKNGFYEGFFPLPKDFPWTKNITLCLKDPFTDEIYCTGYDNPWHVYEDEAKFVACTKAAR